MEPRLNRIVQQASCLTVHEAEELYRIIQSAKCEHTVNQNGTFVNLTGLSSDAVDSIEKFLKFSEDKKAELDTYDRMRETLKADSRVTPLRQPQFTFETSTKPTAMSAMRKESMKFQLLKKRYMKPSEPEGYANPVLTYEHA